MKHTFKNIAKFIVAIAVFSVMTLALAHPTLAAPHSGGTIRVNSNGDTNSKDAGLTLREAILISNGGTSALGRALSDQEKAQLTNCDLTGSSNNWYITNAGGCIAGATDTITFNFSGVIQIYSALPAITDPVTIDGYTAPGAAVNTSKKGMNAKIVVALNGLNAGFYINGLTVSANDSTIKGLNIYGFDGDAIRLEGFRNHVQGNLIHENGSGGVLSLGQENVIGAFDVASRNAIYQNNNDGVQVWYNATGSAVINNMIGLSETAGNSSTGNTGNGVSIYTSSVYTSKNRIAFNHGNGGVVFTGTQDGFDQNLIYSNSKLGIDLGNDGVTQNNSGDAWFDFPTLKTAVSATKIIKGQVTGAANSSVMVQFYSSPSCDGSGYGQGKKYLGLLWVPTNASGVGKFTATVKRFKVGNAVTATAADGIGNGSEFSKCVIAK